MNWSKIWEWIEYNRFVVIMPVAGLILGIWAMACTPTAKNPVNSGQQVNAKELEFEFQVWQKQQEVILTQFDIARADIAQQQQQWDQIQAAIVSLASGSVADWPGVLQLVVGSGLIGAVSDNIRKRGLIAGLKKNA